MSIVISACALCGSIHHEQLYITRDRHYGIKGEFRIVQCESCKLVFLNPMLTDEELKALYPAEYYAYQDKFRSNYIKELGKRILGLRLGQTKDPQFDQPGTMLDIGCGSGWFLQKMRQRGWKVFGVEINASAANLGRTLCGLDIFAGTLHEAGLSSAMFDYVRSNHSFEHLSCPVETLGEIRRILKKGGKLMIGVPNIDSFNARLFKQYWWYLGAPVHTFNYSVATLSALLTKSGFRVIRINYNSDYFGVLGSLQIFANRNRINCTSAQGTLIRNLPLKVLSHWATKVMDLLHLGDCMEVTAVRES